MELYGYEREHIELVRSHLGESCVLLRKDGSFPLDAPCKIAAYGNGVRNTVKGGTGSGEVNSRYFVSVEDGLKGVGFEIVSTSWLDKYDAEYKKARKEFVKSIKKEARAHRVLAPVYGMGKIMPEPEYDIPIGTDGDTAIYVLSRISGEGSDRKFVKGDILLTDTERRDILELNRRYKKFMLILNVGGVVDLSGLESVSNILLLSQLGVETGRAAADILLGNIYPSGKLTTTWASNKSSNHIHFGSHDDTVYEEGIYVGYRYFSTFGIKDLFCFGHGLSYTDFNIKSPTVCVKNGEFTIKAQVENVGAYKGKEVVQAYLSAPAGKLHKPKYELCGFAKTKELSPLESCDIEIKFSIEDMASYDEERECYVLEGGEYFLYLGASLDTVKMIAVAFLPEDVDVLRVKNLCGAKKINEIVPHHILRDNCDGALKITLDPDSLKRERISYEEKAEIDIGVKALTDKELAYSGVGYYNPKGGILSIIGNASAKIAGAAGETTSLLKEKGFDSVIMADGPSGLRLSREFYRDKRGKAHPIGQSGIPDSVLEYLPRVLRRILNTLVGKNKAPRGYKTEYQYATALPIGTAVAQSWNLDLARAYGDIVGDEMERFGVHLWLAPALNIHRSIQCGRNFEYYSEDPILSGYMASAVTRGVQSHRGKGVTIKHFAANNQETNRYGNNSVVSERAMREIYLRGFGICIKNTDPVAVMTSYNLLNGVHTAEHSGILREYLRNELKYGGVVMTDWIIGGGIMADKNDKHPRTTPYKIASAGGDIIMPGCKGDVKGILKGLKKGYLSRIQLEKNATRVYKMTKKLNCNREQE